MDWWGGWVAETSSLLNCRTRKGSGGSNPPLTAKAKSYGEFRAIFFALYNWCKPPCNQGDDAKKRNPRRQPKDFCLCKVPAGAPGECRRPNPPLTAENRMMQIIRFFCAHIWAKLAWAKEMGAKNPECDSTKKVFCKVPREARGMPKAQSPLKNNPTEQDDSNLTYQATIRNRHSYLYATQKPTPTVIQVYPRKTHSNRHPGLSHKNTWLSDLGSEIPVEQIECARCNIIEQHLAHQKPLWRQFARQVFLQGTTTKRQDSLQH